MQFSLGRNRGPSSGSTSASNNSTHSAAKSDAMQRAIERNRQKMAKRQATSQSTPPPMPGAGPRPGINRGVPQDTGMKAPSENSGSSVLAKLRAQREARGAASTSSARPSGMSASAASRPTPTQASAPTRKLVTEAEKIEMSSPARRRSSSPDVNYAEQSPVKALAKSKPSVTAKRKVRAKSKKTGEVTSWGVKLCWGFCLFLLGRLIFSQGGVIEYFDKKSTLDQAYHEVKLLTEENASLMKELELIRHNNRYKKKLVRDHLGYIARDEYLILFPENSETTARGVSSI